MEKYIEQIRKVSRDLSALNEGLHALGRVYTDPDYAARRGMTTADMLTAYSDLCDLSGHIRTLFGVADAIEQQVWRTERQQRPAEEPAKAAKSSPEEITNVELIGFITLLLAKIEARDDENTDTMEQVYEDVLRRYRVKSKGV